MGFDLPSELRSRAGEGPALWARYLNPQTARVVRSIGFDRRWEHGRGCYLYDDTGARYLDFLSGFGVFGLGRSHPTVRATLHDVLDGELPDLVQMDTPLLAGLLAEALIERAPNLDRVYLCNSGTEAVEAALKFARCAHGPGPGAVLRPRLPRPDGRFAVGQRRQGVSGRLRPAAARAPRCPSATSTPSAGSWPPATSPP